MLLEKEFKKLKIFDSGYFEGKNHFEGDKTQNLSHFSQCTSLLKICLAPLKYTGKIMYVKVNGSCLK